MRLLALFPAYQKLARTLEDASTRALIAEQTVRTRDDECRWLREQLVASQGLALNATQALANLGLQRAFGFRMFPDAPAMPTGRVVDNKPGTLQNPTLNSQRAKMIEEFKAQALRQYDEAHGLSETDGTIQELSDDEVMRQVLSSDR